MKMHSDFRCQVQRAILTGADVTVCLDPHTMASVSRHFIIKCVLSMFVSRQSFDRDNFMASIGANSTCIINKQARKPFSTGVNVNKTVASKGYCKC